MSNRKKSVGITIALWTAIWIAIGTVTDNIGLWIGIGAATGVQSV